MSRADQVTTLDEARADIRELEQALEEATDECERLSQLISDIDIEHAEDKLEYKKASAWLREQANEIAETLESAAWAMEKAEDSAQEAKDAL